MAERGYVTVLDASDREVFAEFKIDSTETVRFTLEQDIDGVTTPVDVSPSNLEVRFRLAIIGTTDVPVNILMPDVTDGTDGKVSGAFAPRSTDFSSVINQDGLVEASVVIVDTNVTDTSTLSGNQETEWFGRWLVFIRQAINEVGA